jgi:hypothetical protein
MSNEWKLDSNLPAPPPSPALLDAVGKMKPVRTRVPILALIVVGVLSLAWGAHWLFIYPLRQDMPGLPWWWVLSMGLAWATAFVLPLAAAILPRRGQVLPDAGRAFAIAAICAVLMVIAQFTLNVTVPGKTIMLEGDRVLWGIGHCLRFELKASVVPFVLSMLALRVAVPTATWRLGAAVGAAGGALGGGMLHLLCPLGGASHTGFAHGGGVVVCAIAGALLAPLVLRLLRR